MKTIDKLRISTLAAWTLITLLLALTMSSPYLPHTILHAQQTGPGGVPGDNSGGAVSSVFGRTGAIAAASGDYTASQVTNAAATNAANTFTANQAITAVSAALTLTDTSANNYVQIYASNYGSVFNLQNQNNLEGIFSGNHQLLNNVEFCWTGQIAFSYCDTGLSRQSAGVVQVGSANGGGNATGTIAAANLTLGGIPITQAGTQPTGSCTVIGWVLSNDGHITFCNGTTYVSKI